MIDTVLAKVFGTKHDREVKAMRPILAAIGDMEPQLKALSDAELAAQTVTFREQFAQGASLDDLLIPAFATVREAGRRILNMRHFDVQLIGGIVLHRGKVAEMKTGEGKTLVATLPVYLNALAGKGVHVVTVNDYLAKRDSEWMGRLYKGLGLTVGVIVHDLDDNERRESYRCDITYGTNNEYGFDYLRDNMKFRIADCVQREHFFAIVDEVDSILIDEARTPLIISGPSEESTDKYYKINRIIPNLIRGEVIEGKEPGQKWTTGDYTVDEKHRSVALTEEGVLKMERLLGLGNMYEAINMEINHHVQQALRAHVLYLRDRDYVVKDEEVIIVDEFTGRQMPGRRWSDGLHQAIEAKEGVKIQRENQTLATITFQNYFRMYKKLAGMTGTADTEAAELEKIYKLDVTIIPTNKPLLRKEYHDVVYRTEEEKFRVAELLFFGAVHDIVILLAEQWFVGRNNGDVQLINLFEFRRFCVGRSGHTGQFFIHAEVILERNCRQRLIFALDLDAFLGFDGLMQAVTPAAARHLAAGELIHDDDFFVLDDVIAIPEIQHMRAQGLLHVMVDLHIDGLVHIAEAQEPFHLQHALFGQRDGTMLFVHCIVARGPLLAGLLAFDHFAANQVGDDAVDLVVLVGRFLARPGNNQRRAGFVDQNRVHFIDDGEEVLSLHAVRNAELHVVAQIIEAVLIIGAVGDVAAVTLAALIVVQIVHDNADRQPQPLVQPAHPLRVAFGQVVVHRDYVHTFAR